MCTRPFTIRVPCNTYEKNVLGFSGYKEVKVPCGSCPECLRKRQHDVSVRGYREAVKRGSCFFLTLTYAPNYVPFAQTLLDVNTDTGEVLTDRVPEICRSEFLNDLRTEYKNHNGSVFYKYRTVASFKDDFGQSHEYQVCYTPTLNYRDVRLFIKKFRVYYERRFGKKVNFSYLAVGEYGSKASASHRPHFHLLVFGLDLEQVKFLCSLWEYGFFFYEKVAAKNVDGSDGFAKVCSYVSKYAAKGSFNPDSVTNHLTLKCRISASHGLGLCNINNLIYYHRCYDLFGRYDIENYLFDEDKKIILFNEILKRLQQFDFNGKLSRVPESFKRKLFGFKVVQGQACWSFLYYEFMDFARNLNKERMDEDFSRFCQSQPDKSLSDLCYEYESISKTNLSVRELRQKESFRQYYAKSKF